jgi:hypothetical protein
MCNCKDLPEYVADLECRDRGFNYGGAAQNSRYFEYLNSEAFVPILDYTHNLYYCAECNQRWYIECLPEETPSPGFALKLNDSVLEPPTKEIAMAKQSLSILAHGGFSSDACRIAGCANACLIGRALCHEHTTFP